MSNYGHQNIWNYSNQDLLLDNVLNIRTYIVIECSRWIMDKRPKYFKLYHPGFILAMRMRWTYLCSYRQECSCGPGGVCCRWGPRWRSWGCLFRWSPGGRCPSWWSAGDIPSVSLDRTSSSLSQSRCRNHCRLRLSTLFLCVYWSMELRGLRFLDVWMQHTNCRLLHAGRGGHKDGWECCREDGWETRQQRRIVNRPQRWMGNVAKKTDGNVATKMDCKQGPNDGWEMLPRRRMGNVATKMDCKQGPNDGWEMLPRRRMRNMATKIDGKHGRRDEW